MKKYKLFLWALVIVSVLLSVLSAYQISLGNQMKLEPSYWRFGYLFGAFVWIDLFIFSLLWTVIGLILLKLKRPIYFLLFFSCFWFIRSLGETFYWFLQQFHPETIPWEQYFQRVGFLSNLKDNEFWVFNQIVHQSISVLALFGILYSVTQLLKPGHSNAD